MKHHILCINSGSSSIKFALYLVQETEALIAEGAVERIGLSGGWLWLKNGQGQRLVDLHADYPDHKLAPVVKKNRSPVSADNPFTALEKHVSDSIVNVLDSYQAIRDHVEETLFFTIYENPFMKMLYPETASDKK